MVVRSDEACARLRLMVKLSPLKQAQALEIAAELVFKKSKSDVHELQYQYQYMIKVGSTRLY